LHEVTGTVPVEEPVAVAHRGVAPELLAALEVLAQAADHEARAVAGAARPTGGADVKEAHAAPCHERRTTLGVREARVAAIDDEVARLERLHKTALAEEDAIHGCAGGHHEPHGARWRQRCDELGE